MTKAMLSVNGNKSRLLFGGKIRLNLLELHVYLAEKLQFANEPIKRPGY